MILLSVIVPIYNTNINDLQRCLASLSLIGIEEIEIILIDDGSESYVEKFCVDFVSKEGKFRYLKKENGGVSAARNYGINSASGQYIMFVDSDDVVFPEHIVLQDFQSNADLIFFNKTLYKDGNQKERKEILGKSREVNQTEVFEAMISQNRFHGVTARLYRTFLLRNLNLQFDEEMMQGEDLKFNIMFLEACKSIFYIDKSIYGYYMTPATLRERWKKNSEKMLLNIIDLYYCKARLLALYSEMEKEMLGMDLCSNNEHILFQACLDMIDMNLFRNEIKSRCIEFSRMLSKKACFYKKAKIESFLIENQMWITMKIVGLIRNIYVSKIKKTWE